MSKKEDVFNKTQLKTDLPDIRPGDTVKVNQKISEGDKTRIQAFEGQVISIKHGKGLGSMITVRKIISGVGTEKIFPIHLPSIDNIEVVKRGKARRAKLYYLRVAEGRKAKLKERTVVEEKTTV
jgi:large subunit ribosomal protein L19